MAEHRFFQPAARKLTARLLWRQMHGSPCLSHADIAFNAASDRPALSFPYKLDASFGLTREICKADRCECVALSPAATRYFELSGAMAAACEQFVSSSIVDPQLRRVHRRLVGVLLAAPFLGGGAAVALSTANVGAAATMAVILALFG